MLQKERTDNHYSLVLSQWYRKKMLMKGDYEEDRMPKVLKRQGSATVKSAGLLMMDQCCRS